MLGWVDSIVDFSGTQGKANETVEEAEARIRAEVEEMRRLREETAGTGRELENLAEKGKVNVSVEGNIDTALNDFFTGDEWGQCNSTVKMEVGMNTEEFRAGMDEIVSLRYDAEGNPIVVRAEADQSSMEEAAHIITEILPDGTKKYIQVGMDPDRESLAKTKE